MQIFDQDPNISLDDLGGIDYLKKKISDYLLINIKNKEKYI